MSKSQDPLDDSRAERIAQMVGNLLPRIRPLSGHLSEEELLEAAAYMAIYRIEDESLRTRPDAAEPARGTTEAEVDE